MVDHLNPEPDDEEPEPPTLSEFRAKYQDFMRTEADLDGLRYGAWRYMTDTDSADLRTEPIEGSMTWESERMCWLELERRWPENRPGVVAEGAERLFAALQGGRGAEPGVPALRQHGALLFSCSRAPTSTPAPTSC